MVTQKSIYRQKKINYLFMTILSIKIHNENKFRFFFCVTKMHRDELLIQHLPVLSVYTLYTVVCLGQLCEVDLTYNF